MIPSTTRTPAPKVAGHGVCEACGKALAIAGDRFCSTACRAAMMERWRHGTPSAPGRTAAHRRRRRGR